MADFVGQGPIGLPGSTSVVYTTPYPMQRGSRAKDSSGNEYIFVDFVGTVNGAQPVQINSDYTAQPIGAQSARGPGGIACQRATSDQAGWVQIYGRAIMQITTDADHVSPSNNAALTTLSTSAKTLFYVPTSLTSPPTVAYTDHSTDPSIWRATYFDGVQVAQDATVSSTTLIGPGPATTSGVAPYIAHTGAFVAVFINYPNFIHHNWGE